MGMNCCTSRKDPENDSDMINPCNYNDCFEENENQTIEPNFSTQSIL